MILFKKRLNAKTDKDAEQMGVLIAPSFRGCGLTEQINILSLGNTSPDSAIPLPENKPIRIVTNGQKHLITECSSPFHSYPNAEIHPNVPQKGNG